MRQILLQSFVVKFNQFSDIKINTWNIFQQILKIIKDLEGHIILQKTIPWFTTMTAITLSTRINPSCHITDYTFYVLFGKHGNHFIIKNVEQKHCCNQSNFYQIAVTVLRNT